MFESCSSTSVRVVGKKINISQSFRYTIKVHKLGIKAISKNFHQIVSPWKKLESKKVLRNFSRKCLKNQPFLKMNRTFRRTDQMPSQYIFFIVSTLLLWMVKKKLEKNINSPKHKAFGCVCLILDILQINHFGRQYQTTGLHNAMY